MTVGDVADGKAMRLQDLFADLFVKLGGPEEAGMFGSMDVMSNDYFFSPEAATIALPLITAYGGVECAAPKRSQVSYLVVNQGARNVPFAPER